MKKCLAACLSIALILSLVACSGANTSSSANNSSTPKIDSVSNKTITITVTDWNNSTGESSTSDCTGSYTGEVIDGVPNGTGTFTSSNADSVTWTYTGEFKDGKFNGQGTTIWEEIGYEEAGTYTDGAFTPTTAELFRLFGPDAGAAYSISDKNFNFIQDNPDIFPAITEESKETASTFIDTNLTYPMLTKTLNGHEGKLYQCNYAKATQVTEVTLYGHTVTISVIRDEDLNYYYTLYDGSLPDIYDGTYISFTGLPVASSGFENVGGGVTNVIVLIASDMSAV